MFKQNLLIENIPAIIWGKKSNKMIVAVHGNMSNKNDIQIAVLAEEASMLGYQVLSFDLPEHGDRKAAPELCKVQNCVRDLCKVMGFVRQRSSEISLFACSIGAYFSLLAYREVPLRQCLFLSPVVDMSRIIYNMMTWFHVSREQLKSAQEIPIPTGNILYWDYYCYVQENPIVQWNSPTNILYGKDDSICEIDVVSYFSKKFNCTMEVMDKGEHYFHTPEQLEFFREWLKKYLIV